MYASTMPYVYDWWLNLSQHYPQGNNRSGARLSLSYIHTLIFTSHENTNPNVRYFRNLVQCNRVTIIDFYTCYKTNQLGHSEVKRQLSDYNAYPRGVGLLIAFQYSFQCKVDRRKVKKIGSSFLWHLIQIISCGNVMIRDDCFCSLDSDRRPP